MSIYSVGAAIVVVQAVLIGVLVCLYRTRRGSAPPRDGEDRFRLLADSAPVLIWRAGTDKRCDYFNRRWLEFTGRTLEQELGNGWADGVWSEDRARCMEIYASAFDARQPFRLEYRLRAANGVYKWVLDTGVPRFGPDGMFEGYIGSCIDINDARASADATRESEAALRASERKIRHLAGHLIAAQENERARIARDLHDDVSQRLAGLSIALSSLKRRLGTSAFDASVQNDLASLQQQTVALAENVRHLSRDLHPDVLKHIGLSDALKAYCDEVQRQHGVFVTCSAGDGVQDIAPAVAICLYRVAQETLRNVISHAEAQRADVRLVSTDDVIELTISDDGKGFDIVEVRRRSSGLGLVSMNERVRLAGGAVSILTEVNRGTLVRIRIPVHGSVPADLHHDLPHGNTVETSG